MHRLPRPLGVAARSVAFLAAGLVAGLGGGLAVSSATAVPVPETLFVRQAGDARHTGRLVRSLPVVEGARQRACPVGDGYLDLALSWDGWNSVVLDDFAPVAVFRTPPGSLAVETSRVFEGRTGNLAILVGRAVPGVGRVRAVFEGGAADEMAPVQGWFALAGPWTSGPASVWAIGTAGASTGSVVVPDTPPPGTPTTCLGRIG